MEHQEIHDQFMASTEEIRESLWRVLEDNGYKKDVDFERLRADASAALEASFSTTEMKPHFAAWIMLGLATVSFNCNDMPNAIRSLSQGSRLLGFCEAAALARNPAAELAKRRHAENYALVDEAIRYWREHIDQSLSAAKAADELIRVVPLSHKKLAEVVAAERKRQS